MQNANLTNVEASFIFTFKLTYIQYFQVGYGKHVILLQILFL